MEKKGMIVGTIASALATAGTYVGLAVSQMSTFKQKGIELFCEAQAAKDGISVELFKDAIDWQVSLGNTYAIEMKDKILQAGSDYAMNAFSSATTIAGTVAVAAVCVAAMLYYRKKINKMKQYKASLAKTSVETGLEK